MRKNQVRQTGFLACKNRFRNWPNQQCCLAGGSKTAPRILIFSIAMGAEYLSYVKSIVTFAIKFYRHIIAALASV